MPISNAHLVRWRDGWRWVKDTASEGTWQRREAGLSLGNAQSPDEVDRVTAAIQVTQARPQVSTTIAIEPAGPGESPYTGFNVGDTVTAPDETGASVEMRVVGVTVKQDDAGNVIYVPELRFLRDEPERQLRRTTQRMTGGTVGGTVESATPAQSVAQGGLPTNLQTDQAKWATYLADVGTSPPYMNYQGTTGPPGRADGWGVFFDTFNKIGGPGIDPTKDTWMYGKATLNIDIASGTPDTIHLFANHSFFESSLLMPWVPGTSGGVWVIQGAIYGHPFEPSTWGASVSLSALQQGGGSSIGSGAITLIAGGFYAFFWQP